MRSAFSHAFKSQDFVSQHAFKTPSHAFPVLPGNNSITPILHFFTVRAASSPQFLSPVFPFGGTCLSPSLLRLYSAQPSAVKSGIWQPAVFSGRRRSGGSAQWLQWCSANGGGNTQRLGAHYGTHP
ncbi:hypothetical protein GUJ93_ZPchr0014g46525 [Zizania palustris]|uniref:Uncharacterized protein n=1 Tax=Zizania palustris TaxID=103762 RepID=A0A8J5T7R9_ZIZPA|nr:hypothetical protein GUJ93_ZPchr0014g46525 [Zizania palustris]